MMLPCSIQPESFTFSRFFREVIQSTYRTFVKEINKESEQLLNLIHGNIPYPTKKGITRVFHPDIESSVPFFNITFSDCNSGNVGGERSCSITSLKTCNIDDNSGTLICEVDCLDQSLTVKIDSEAYHTLIDLTSNLKSQADEIVKRITFLEKTFINIYLRQVNLKVHHGFNEEVYEEFV